MSLTPLLATALTIAFRGGDVKYDIVVPESPAPAVQYAAEEFRDWTAALTGVRLPIVREASAGRRRVTLKPTDAYGPDGFRLHAENGDVVVEGSAARGVLYGVQELLETYGGIGWYASDHTVVPKGGRFEIPATLDDVQCPAFDMRVPFFWDPNYHPEFAARLRKNSAPWSSLAEKYGGDRFRGGTDLLSHSFGTLLPVDRYFDAHPEYFAEVGGKRQRTRTQLCLTNPEVLRIVTSNLLARIRREPDRWFYAVAHDDNRTYCQCAACRKVIEEEGAPSGNELRFVNAVAAEVAREFPGKMIKFIAYEFTRRPPRHVRPRDNVIVELCPIECDFARPIPKSSYRANVEFVADITRWAAICRNLSIFDYVTDFNDYYHPFANVFSLQDNLRFFRDHNCRYIFEEGVHNTPHGDFAELKTWLLAKLMWNPEQNVDRLVNRFLEGYYGRAAPHVRAYLDALHALPRDPQKAPLLIGEKFNDPAIPDDFLAHALTYWVAAERAVAEDSVALGHVRVGKLSVAMTLLQRRAYRVCCMRSDFPSADVRALAADTLATLDGLKGKNLSLGEGGPKPLNRLKTLWRRYADPAFTVPAADRQVVEAEDVLTSWGFESGARPDAQAVGGQAFRYVNRYSGDWVTYLPSECFGHDAGTRYHLRMRVRVEPKEGGRDAEIFDIGVSSPNGRMRSVMAHEAGPDYRWIDVGDWLPKPNEYLYIAFGRFDRTKSLENPAVKGVWLDQIEFTHVDAAVVVRSGDPTRLFIAPEVPRFSVSNAVAGTTWSVIDWRGAERCRGALDATRTLAVTNLPPGYWRLRVPGAKDLAFTTTIDPSTRRRVEQSAYAADSAFSWMDLAHCYQSTFKTNYSEHLARLMWAAGISQTRERFCWSDVQKEKNGPITWGRYLRNERMLAAKGIRVSWINANAPTFVGGKGGGWGPQSLAKDLVAVRDFCERVGRDFGSTLADFEYLNEPDLSLPAWDATAQFKAASVGFRAAKSGVPTANFSMCLGVDFNYDNLVFDNGMAKYIDLFNIHSYSVLVDYDAFDARIHRFLERRGIGDLPILITECGTEAEGEAKVPTDVARCRAQTPEQEMIVADFIPKSQIKRQFGGVWRNHFFIFASFHERGGRKDWGVVRRDGSARPGVAAFAALTAELDGFRQLGRVDAGPGVEAYLYDRGAGVRTLAFWGHAAARIDVSSAQPVRLVDWCGTAKTLPAGKVTVPVERHVSYLTGAFELPIAQAATPVGTLRLHGETEGEDAEIVIRADFPSRDFDLVDGYTAVETRRNGEGVVKVEIWNLSDRVKRGRITSENAELVGWPEGEIELPARGVFAREVTLRPRVGKDGEARWRLTGVFDGKATTPFLVPVRDFASGMTTLRRVAGVASDPANWTKNTSAPNVSFTPEGEAMRIDLDWVTGAATTKGYDRWAYNHFRVPEAARRGVRYVAFEIRSEQDKVENTYQCANVYTVGKGRGDRIVCNPPMKEWTRIHVAIPQKADAPVDRVGIGGNPVGRKVTMWVRNIEFYCAD